MAPVKQPGLAGSMASMLFVLNDAPYGNERTYNGLRHAMAVAKDQAATVRVFLMADATACVLPAR